MKFSWLITNDRSDVHAKSQDQRSKVKVRGQNNLAVSGLELQVEFAYDDEIMHKVDDA